MQRRAAAVYTAFFLVVAVGAFGFAATADDPSMSIDADYEVQEDGEFEIDGVTYTVGAIDQGEDGDPATVEITWVDESGTITESWGAGDTVTYQGEEYTVEIVEEDADEDEEPERTLELVSDEDRQRFSQGDTLTYNGNETTVDSITDDEVTVSWTGPVDQSRSLTHGIAGELGGTEHIAIISPDGTVELTNDIEGYNEESQRVDDITQRINAVWVIGILGSLAAFTLLGMAFLPRKER